MRGLLSTKTVAVTLTISAVAIVCVPSVGRADTPPKVCLVNADPFSVNFSACVQIILQDLQVNCFVDMLGRPACGARATVGAIGSSSISSTGGTFSYHVVATSSYDLVTLTSFPYYLPGGARTYDGSGSWQGAGSGSDQRAVQSPLVTGRLKGCIRYRATFSVSATAMANGMPGRTHFPAVDRHQHPVFGSKCAPK